MTAPDPARSLPGKEATIQPPQGQRKRWLYSLVKRIFGIKPTSEGKHNKDSVLPKSQLDRGNPLQASGVGFKNYKKKGKRESASNNRSQRRNPDPAPAHTSKSGTLLESPPFQMITSTEELEAAVRSFAPHPRIALDTEADSLHCYFDKLCLIQITIPGSNFLIDPLAGFSLDPLFNALEGKTVIIHSADYDLRLLRRGGYQGPTVLFDTMIAARLCGATEFGLAALLHQHFGVTLAKASQKANWARRPLPPRNAGLRGQ